ncbi:hypothetical protein vseg_000705 [Gypsophila vaccaria]
MEESIDRGDEKRVCVTGASGYIASWIVKLLLERGYVVHATVRSLNDATKTEHLLAMEGAKTRLKMYEANLVEEGSFDKAIQGCCGVFHTASPVLIDTPNPQENLIDPALKGTVNVLGSCAKTTTVKRVIFTSSIAAVMHGGRPITSDTLVDESWFSTPEGCKDVMFGEWYVLSKTLAEGAAWKYTKEKGIDMVSINPALVIGPMLQPNLNWSSDVLYNLVNGKSETYMNVSFGYVHVKDVAEAHIRAFEIPSANGRYILAESVAHFSQLVHILRQLYPTLKLPSKCENDEPFQPTYKFSKDKVTSLGIEYIPLKVALKETVDFFIERNLISV